MKNETDIIPAILTLAAHQNCDYPETVITTYESIRKRLEDKTNEALTVPKAHESLLKWALEEKARRQQKM